MKQFILLLFGLILTTTTTFAREFDYTCEGNTFQCTVLDDNSNTVEIKRKTGTDAPSGRLEIPSKVYDENIEYTVTSIAKNGFQSCKNITEISIPSSATSIGWYAFYNCTGLQKAEFESVESLLSIKFNGEEYFLEPFYTIPAYANPLYYAHHLYINGKEVTEVVIPDGITAIGNCTFIGCSELTSITIPNSVKSIDNYAFHSCNGLTSITIPDSVETIGYYCFYQCTNLKNITLSKSLDCINPGLFIDCSNLMEIDMPDSVTAIKSEAFKGCSSLTSVNIPNSVISIGAGAFNDCSTLTSINIPGSITKIKESTFENCKSLTSITIPNSVTTIGWDAFYNCTGMTDIYIPKSVTSINNYAFTYCNSLKIVNIESPNLWSQLYFEESSYDRGDLWRYTNPICYSKSFSVNNQEVKHLDLNLNNSSVSQYTFCNSSNLNTIRIKGKNIGKKSFYKCNNVTAICLDVESIDDESFDCENLKTIYCLTEEPPTATYYAFPEIFHMLPDQGGYYNSYLTNVTLFIPYGSLSKYQQSDCWKNCKKIIETDFSGIDEIFKADYEDNNFPTGINNTFADNTSNEIDFNRPLEVYNLNGIKVSTTTDNLTSGIYIIRQGSAVKKIVINN